jgi:hypothetical protein
VTVEVSPESVTRKAVRAAKRVTARIREPRAEFAEVEPESEEPPTVVIPLPEPVKPAEDYWQNVTRRRQGVRRRLSLLR